MSRLLQAAGLGLAGEIPGIGDTGAKGSVPREGDLAKPGRRAAACTRPGTRRAGGETAPGPSPSSPPQVPQLGSAGSGQRLLLRRGHCGIG